jgi:hypothetical protein
MILLHDCNPTEIPKEFLCKFEIFRERFLSSRDMEICNRSEQTLTCWAESGSSGWRNFAPGWAAVWPRTGPGRLWHTSITSYMRVYQKLSGLIAWSENCKMVQLFASRCNCIAILWDSLVSFTAVTLCVASQRVFVVVVVFLFCYRLSPVASQILALKTVQTT